MSISKIVGFEEKDIPVLNNILEDLDTRLTRIDNTIPTADVDETKFSHKLKIVINDVSYWVMLTTS